MAQCLDEALCWQPFLPISAAAWRTVVVTFLFSGLVMFQILSDSLEGSDLDAEVLSPRKSIFMDGCSSFPFAPMNPPP